MESRPQEVRQEVAPRGAQPVALGVAVDKRAPEPVLPPHGRATQARAGGMIVRTFGCGGFGLRNGDIKRNGYISYTAVCGLHTYTNDNETHDVAVGTRGCRRGGRRWVHETPPQVNT